MRHRREDAPADLLFGHCREEPLHQVRPRRAGWREVQEDGLLALDPVEYLLMLVRPVVVQDDVKVLASTSLRNLNTS